MDLSGQAFGLWSVLKRDLEKDRYYICRCECGFQKSVIGSSLRNGTSKHCRAGHHYKKPGDLATKNRAYHNHLACAKRRKIKTFLSFEDFISIASRLCVYCGNTSNRKDHYKMGVPLNSVDRKDNEPFYKLSNSQSTCFDCQIGKSTMTHLEFIDLILETEEYMRLKA